MNEREKLKKEITEVVSKQIQSNTDIEAGDIYPIDQDILAYAYNYVPIKILRRIIKENKQMIKGVEGADDSNYERH